MSSDTDQVTFSALASPDGYICINGTVSVPPGADLNSDTLENIAELNQLQNPLKETCEQRGYTTKIDRTPNPFSTTTAKYNDSKGFTVTFDEHLFVQ